MGKTYNFLVIWIQPQARWRRMWLCACKDGLKVWFWHLFYSFYFFTYKTLHFCSVFITRMMSVHMLIVNSLFCWSGNKIADKTPYMPYSRVLTALSVLSLLSHGFQLLTSYIYINLRNRLYLNTIVLCFSPVIPNASPWRLGDAAPFFYVIILNFCKNSNLL